MAEANKIEVVEEEQIVVEMGKPEVIEGFSHLTKEDLDPDYVPTKETEPEAEQVATKTEVSDTSEGEELVAESKDSPEAWNINGTSYNESDLPTRMVKDYQNLTSFAGKQAEEIGRYKHEIDTLKKEPVKAVAANETPVDPKSYDIYTQDGVQEIARDEAKRMIDKQNAVAIKAAHEKKFTDDANGARNQFMERHPEYADEATIINLIQETTARGLSLGAGADSDVMLNYLETAHAQKSNDYSYFMESSGNTKSETTKHTVNKIEEGKKVKETLTKVNSSDTTIDYDALNDADWAKLPEEKRQELLGLT
jgi:hypothetical protein